MQETIQYNGLLFRKHPKQNYYYSTASGKRYSRILHRQMWFDKYGEIPDGVEVHHKNENPFDNRIENFELRAKGFHSREHRKREAVVNPKRFIDLQKKGTEAAKAWHGSREGIEWHREHARKIKFGKRTFGETECLYCGKLFTKKAGHAKFCCFNHTMAWRRKNNPDNVLRKCESCDTEYSTLKYRQRRFCSSKCRKMVNKVR